MSEHTRGPWRRRGWYVHGAGGSIVCRVIPWDECGTREEDQGNVNLIAAATDLLVALRAIRAELLRREGPYIVASEYAYLNDAIAKAEGKQ